MSDVAKNFEAVDLRGVKRGKCTACLNCARYRRDIGRGNSRCSTCNCHPGKHIMEEGEQPKSLQAHSFIRKAIFDGSGSFTLPKCQFCKDDCYFDINSQSLHPYCQFHLLNRSDISVNVPVASSQVVVVQSSADAGIGGKNLSVCAIEDCYKPRHIDENGKVHDCCGYSHAMELQRRKAIKKMQQPVVKGVSHCLLPDCNNVTWPFMNYCGRTHAERGKQLGLYAPVQDDPGNTSTATSKDPSLCGLPECHNPRCRNSDDGSLYDFCGRTHALAANQRGIKVAPESADDSGPKLDSMCRLDECRKLKKKSPDGTMFDYCCKDHAEKAASNASSVTKNEDMCIIPECTRLKYTDPDTNQKSDYCGRSHVEEGRKRGIQRVLKSRDEVDTYLKSFSTQLTVIDIKENDHAKPGGVLYKKFVAARDSLAASDRKTCLAFHGTADANIDSICTNGYDPSKRSGQAYGAGEYFATSPSTPLQYVQGGKRILLNELLLGQSGVHHTQHGDIVVMKTPEHDLPRFIVTFK